MPEYTVHLEDIMVKFTPLGHQDIIKDQNVLINDPLNVLLDGSLEKIVLSAIKGNSHKRKFPYNAGTACYKFKSL